MRKKKNPSIGASRWRVCCHMQQPAKDLDKFRRESQFPGEEFIFRYEFKEGDTQKTGYLGFGFIGKLLSIDERLPTTNQVYLGETSK